MDKRKQHKVSTRVAIIAIGLPLSAHAFIDERTQQKTPEPTALVVEEVVSTPPAPIKAPIMPVVSETVAPQPVPPQAVSVQAGVRGDFSDKVWQTAYPGPYGQMELADALIAQVVPAVGGAISLSGPQDLLSKKVNVPQGLNRIDTLGHMAQEHQLGIVIQGKTVSLMGATSAHNPSNHVPIIVSETTVATAVDTAVATVDTTGGEPVTVTTAPQTKTWDIPVGMMLSTAMLHWAEQWGWTLIWQADIDYRIAAPIHIEANFLDGVSQVLAAYRQAHRPLWGDWQEQQKILVIREPSALDQ